VTAAPLRVGIVGANPDRGWAVTAHLPALRALDGFVVTAVSTTRMETARRTAAEWQVSAAYDDAAPLIASDDVDVVAVCVKVPAHRAIVEAALRAGRHVYCEWPLGVSAAEAEHLEQLARAQGVVAVCGLQGRADPGLRHARALLQEGRIGEVLSAVLVGTSALGGALVPEEYAFGVDPAQGMNVLTVPTGHATDMLCSLLGEPLEVDGRVATRFPAPVVAETGAPLRAGSPDQVQATLTFPGDVAATVHVQGGAVFPAGFRLELFGREGRMTLSTPGHLQRDAVRVEVSGPDGALVAEPPPAPDPELAGIPPGAPANVGHLYAELGRAVRGEPAELQGFDVAVRRQRMLEAIVRASETGAVQRHR